MRVIDVEQGTPQWQEARAGVLTGTTLKPAMGKNYTDVIYDLIAQTLAPEEPSYTNETMERGMALEEYAIEAYEQRTGEITEAVGFCLHKEHDWLGLSPDRLIQRDGKYVKGVEVKAPTSKYHIKYLASDKVPADYKYQVVQYFLVCEDLEEVDFVSYDPRIAIEDLQLKIITVKREDMQKEIDETWEHLQKFRQKWEEINDNLVF